MIPSYAKKPLAVLAFFAALWLGVKYLLPVVLPFLLGAGVAVAAEPLVSRAANRLNRPLAAGLGVTATILGIGTIICLAGAVLVREAGSLARTMPNLEDMTRDGLTMAQDLLIDLSHRAPEAIQPALQRTVLNFFDDGTVLLNQVTEKVPGAVTAALGWMGNGALALGTALLSAFLISVRLPKLKEAFSQYVPKSWEEKYLPALRRVRHALGGWLKAQLKLSAVTWGVVSVGFAVVGIPYGPAWAILVALVDAVPVLGTGTVLVPWAVISLLQGEGMRGVGLLCTYVVALILRTVLEPRFMGKQLGLDPLLTLAAMYLGFRFWGILGLLLTPILASAAKSMIMTDKLS